MNKSTGIGKFLTDAMSYIGSGIKTGYEGLDKLAWYAVPTAAILGTLGVIRALRPEAVAKNSDKLLLQGTLLASLAKSKRHYDQLKRDEEAATLHGLERRHDRFI